jgi:hypothetical protein
MGSGTQFDSPLQLSNGSLTTVHGPLTYTNCLAIAVAVVQTQAVNGTGAAAAGSANPPQISSTNQAGSVWQLPVNNLASALPFMAGMAQASAVAVVNDRGTVKVVEWSQEVELQ